MAHWHTPLKHRPGRPSVSPHAESLTHGVPRLLTQALAICEYTTPHEPVGFWQPALCVTGTKARVPPSNWGAAVADHDALVMMVATEDGGVVGAALPNVTARVVVVVPAVVAVVAVAPPVVAGLTVDVQLR